MHKTQKGCGWKTFSMKYFFFYGIINNNPECTILEDLKRSITVCGAV